MAALTAERDTMRKGHDYYRLDRPVAAGVKVWLGALVATNAAGFVVPATEAPDLIVIGRADETVDNTLGANGDKAVEVWSRCRFNYANDVGAPLTQAQIGQICYAVDDQTVSASDNGGTRSPAGYFMGFDQTSSSVWVQVHPHPIA